MRSQETVDCLVSCWQRPRRWRSCRVSRCACCCWSCHCRCGRHGLRAFRMLWPSLPKERRSSRWESNGKVLIIRRMTLKTFTCYRGLSEIFRRAFLPLIHGVTWGQPPTRRQGCRLPSGQLEKTGGGIVGGLARRPPRHRSFAQ